MKFELDDETRGVAEATREVEGWFSDPEGSALYHLAKQCAGRGAIVEVGSWQGKSAIWLARGSRAGPAARVYAIDPHTGSQEHREAYGDVWTLDRFRDNVAAAGVDDLVEAIVAPSEEAAGDFDRPVELVHIDGDHSYEAATRDFELWTAKLVDGGWVAIHDTASWNDEGPRRVVRERIVRSRGFRRLGFADSLTYAQKVPRASPADVARNHAVWWLKGVVELLRRAQLPPRIRAVGKSLLRRL